MDFEQEIGQLEKELDFRSRDSSAYKGLGGYKTEESLKDKQGKDSD